MMNIFKNWKVTLIIVIIIAVIIFLIYRWGKKSANGPQVQLPGGTQAVPSGWSPEPLAKELHDAMDGLFTLSGTKEEAWKKAYDLPTDAMLVLLYNTFGQLYFNEGNGTLTQWIRDENYFTPAIMGGVHDQLLARMQKLNLS